MRLSVGKGGSPKATMNGNSKADDGGESNRNHATGGVALDKLVSDAKDIRNAAAFAERNAEGRVSLELDHTVEDLESAVERLERADVAADTADNVATEAFEKGDRAYINEENGGEVIILATPDVRAEDYVVPGTSETIADYNGECSPKDPVVQTVFVESVEEAFGTQWTDETVAGLFEDGLLADHADHYAYPDSRLTTENPES